jgi:hypothetical protein
MRAELMGALEGLTPEQLVDRPDGGWSVKDQLFHLAAWDTIRAAEVTRISNGHSTTWKMSDEQDALMNDLFFELQKDLPIEQAMWELISSRERLLAALEGATERGLDPSLYGEAGLMTRHEAEHAGWIREWRERNGY